MGAAGAARLARPGIMEGFSGYLLPSRPWMVSSGAREWHSKAKAGCDARPWLMWRARRPASSPAGSTHLVQEAHEIAEHGVVVLREALQDLAAVGDPQAALHTCNGRGSRVRPEGRAQVERGPTVSLLGPGLPLTARPCRCSQQTPLFCELHSLLHDGCCRYDLPERPESPITL